MEEVLGGLKFGDAESVVLVGEACNGVEVVIVAATARVAVWVDPVLGDEVKVTIVVAWANVWSVVVVMAEMALCVWEDSETWGSNGFANGFSSSSESSSSPSLSSSLSSSPLSSASPAPGGIVPPVAFGGGTGEDGTPS